MIVYRLRLHPASPRTDRIALEDDVIPLSNPIQTTDGKTITSIPIKAGQVRDDPTWPLWLSLYQILGY